MKCRLKKNTPVEDAYVRDLERRGPLEQVERGQASIIAAADYPPPIKRFLSRQRGVLRVQLSASQKKKLEHLSRATGVSVDRLARRWVEQGLAREAG